MQGVLEGMQAKQRTFDPPGADGNTEHFLHFCRIKMGKFDDAFVGKRIGQDRHAGLADRTTVARPTDVRYPLAVHTQSERDHIAATGVMFGMSNGRIG